MWRFLPDMTSPGQSWWALDTCAECTGAVPVARIATLADLGDYLDPDTDIQHPGQYRHDPGHRPGCRFGPTPPAA